jgi:hypothetical protein
MLKLILNFHKELDKANAIAKSDIYGNASVRWIHLAHRETIKFKDKSFVNKSQQYFDVIFGACDWA